MSKELDNYIVYIVRQGDEIIYIGSGLKDRYNHCISGTSHVYELNKLHFQGIKVDVKIHRSGLTKQESIKIEKELILTYRPIHNKVYLKDKNTAVQKANISKAAGNQPSIATGYMRDVLDKMNGDL